tara:strand:+ start:854 stop:1306 length:453 start_codon:yes stop_codon:yes gene_type:complete
MYDTSVRGEIKYRDRAKQLISYRRLERMRNITPTDIDGFIDYNGNAFVYMDAKLYEKEIDFGQKRAFENVINSHGKAGHPTCAIIFRHNSPSNEDIMAHSCYVDDYYSNLKWNGMKLDALKWYRLLNKEITVLNFLNEIELYWSASEYRL